MHQPSKIHKFVTDSEEYQELKNIIKIIGDKWSVLIIICVFNEPKRFKDIEQFAKGISPRTLSQKLNNLENLGMITRKEYKEFPPRIEYQATKKAIELRDAIQELKIWAKKYCKDLKEIN